MAVEMTTSSGIESEVVFGELPYQIQMALHRGEIITLRTPTPSYRVNAGGNIACSGKHITRVAALDKHREAIRWVLLKGLNVVIEEETK